jgi:Tfp pilus assembly protein PilF
MTDTIQVTIYQCAKCGVESTVKEAFNQIGRKEAVFPIFLCLECLIKKKARSHLDTYLILLFFGIFFYFVVPYSGIRIIYFQLLAGMMLFIPLIFLHEMAHALTTKALGLRVFGIYIGVGDVTFTTRFFGFRWYLRRYLLGGATIFSGPDMPWYRLRRFLIILAGPALHALLIGLMVFIRQYTVITNFWLDQFVTINLYTNLVILLVNLFPHHVVTAAGMAGTDGWVLINMLLGKEKDLEKNCAMYYVQEAVDAVDRGQPAEAKNWIEQGLARYPNEATTVNGIGYVYSVLNQPQKARPFFVRALEMSEGQSQLLYYMAMNNIAYTNTMIEDPALLEQADDYSAQAYQNLPWEPAIIGTRGAVLVWKGQVEQGIELLKTSMARTPDNHGKASNACGIALGEIRRGNRSEAQKYLDAARKLDPQCQMIERVQREF